MPRISEKQIFDLIGALYDLAQDFDPEAWSYLYRKLAALFASDIGGLTVFKKDVDEFSLVASVSPPDLLADYHLNYRSRSPIAARIMETPAGASFNRQNHIGDGDFRKTEIFHDFYRRYGIFHLEYTVFRQADDSQAALSFSRPEGRKNLTPGERSLLISLAPHFARAFDLHFNLIAAHTQRGMMMEAFDRLPQGVIVIDRHSKLRFVNTRAWEHILTSDGLCLERNGSLGTVLPESDFRRLLHGIFSRYGRREDRFGGTFTIRRPSGARPLHVDIAPLTHKEFRGISSETLAILFVTDPETAGGANLEQYLQDRYSLTPAEARFAVVLADVPSFGEACEQLSILENTGRTHLKRIYSKTDTHRQSALVRLVIEARSVHRLGG